MDDLSYILNQLGEHREDYLNAVAPPLFQSSNFAFPDVATMRTELQRELEVPFYTRGYNPTVAILRSKLAALDGAEDALVFSSGTAAIAAAIMSVVKAGDHVVCVQKPYSWTNKLLNKYLVQYGVTTTMADGTDTAQISAAINEQTKLIYLESPNSITFELQDLEAVARLAKEKGITTICDNSYCTPLLQQPIRMGIDMTVQSATKYLNGHSDVVAGVVCGSKERIMRMFNAEFMTLGAIISPHDAWMMLRGLRTLPLRMERSAASAFELAKRLEGHPAVATVYHPFLPGHPQHELAKRQMKSGSGLLSIALKSERVEDTETFCNNLHHFLLATSWGGYESLVYPLCVLSESPNYASPVLRLNLVRLYVGLEDVDALWEDLKAALDKIA
ncbi:MAG: PLP-dependent transferase [Flavobacteriales bacterium]|nr:PLP-dependent transferase [Flavobacteriales bacterium]MCB9448397.1 PLP-dependent transferase [Flavobacteriales bacterium]